MTLFFCLIPYTVDLNHPMIDQLRRKVGAMSRLHVIEVINRVFFQDSGFDGNFDDYYDPNNSLLDKVAERKIGTVT